MENGQKIADGSSHVFNTRCRLAKIADRHKNSQKWMKMQIKKAKNVEHDITQHCFKKGKTLKKLSTCILFAISGSTNFIWQPLRHHKVPPAPDALLICQPLLLNWPFYSNLFTSGSCKHLMIYSTEALWVLKSFGNGINFKEQ